MSERTSPVRISTVVVSYRRDDALAETLDRLAELAANRDDHLMILVDNNADGMDRSGLLKRFGNAVYLRMPRNEGVTGGRNAGIGAAKGDVVLFLDDDAYPEGPADLYASLLAAFDGDPSLGAIAFRSVVGENRIDDAAEFPHTDKSKRRNERFETFRYIGVGHAVRRECFARLGGYRDEFFYGMEEFDMSFRLMNGGFRIVYDPSFMVHHRKQPSGRLKKADVVRRMYLNKLRVAWMHLPARLFAACSLAWTVKTVLDSRSLATFLSGAAEFMAWAASHRHLRSPVSGEVIARIRHLGGAPWK